MYHLYLYGIMIFNWKKLDQLRIIFFTFRDFDAEIKTNNLLNSAPPLASKASAISISIYASISTSISAISIYTNTTTTSITEQNIDI